MIEYKSTKDFEGDQLKELFLSVGWFSGKFPQKLKEAFRNCGCVISAWDGNELVGLIRGLNDGVWLATIDCLLVKPKYWNQGIASTLLKLFLEEHEEFLYVDVFIDNEKDVSLYKKHGFNVLDGTTTLRIMNKKWV